jgi:peptidoglycan/xylan/chitin deacetylase (PgdA/CDA1 family)
MGGHQRPQRTVGRPRASLTFDDGPHRQTLELLRVLEQYRVPATFFQVGAYVRAAPEIARAVAEGHELGNHTDTHPWLWRTSPGRIEREVARAQAAILAATGRLPRLFRPTYGVPGLGLGRALRRHGLSSVGWTVIGNDWKLRAPAIAARVLKRLRPGAIICLHDGRDRNASPDIAETIEAVRILVPSALARGFEFVTLSELLWPTTTSPNA